MLRALGWASGLAVVALVVLSGDFALNVLQIRSSVPPSALDRFEMGAVNPHMEYGLVIVALAVSSRALIRTAQTLRTAPQSSLVLARDPQRKA